MPHRKGRAIALVLLLGTSLLIGLRAPSGAAAVKTCKLGTNLPLTGGWSAFGVGMFNSFKLAIDQANASGELKDVRLEVLRGDHAGDTAQAVALATRHGQDPQVVAEFCCWSSGIGLATHAVYNRYGVPVILGGSNDHRSTRPYHNSRVVFRNSPYDLINMKMAAIAAVEVVGAKRIFLIDDRSPFGRTQVDEFAKVVRKIAGDAAIIGRESVALGEKDFTPLLTKIRPLNPDLINYGGHVNEASLLRQQMIRLGMNIPLQSSGGVFSDTYIKITGPAAEGSIATFWGLPIEYYPEGRGVKFAQAYKEAGFDNPYESFGPMAHAAGQVYVQTIKRVGCDREKILRDLETQEYDTILGRFRFDEHGMLTIHTIGLYRVTDGAWKLTHISDPKATRFSKVGAK